MLSADQVRPFLLHDDELVRERALVYFSEAADRSLLSADDLWAIVDRYGPVARPFHALGRATHTAASTDRLMRELENGRAHPHLRTLQEAAAGLPLDQLEMLLGRFGKDSAILGISERIAELRFALSQESEEVLWAKLVLLHETFPSDKFRASGRHGLPNGRGRDHQLGDYFSESAGTSKDKRKRESFAMYAFGLFGDGERKSAEPIAARAGGEPLWAQRYHNKLLHFLAYAQWSDGVVSAGVRSAFFPHAEGFCRPPE